MTRIVITFAPNEQDQLSFRLQIGPVAPLDKKPRLFPYESAQLPTGKPPPPPSGWVGQYGQQLWTGLLLHPEVRDAIGQAMRLRAGSLQPILFLVEDPRAELFNWEMLCDQTGQFLALDGRWPIGRIAEPGVDLNRPTPDFVPPLKLMAVLSALGAGATGRQEWSGLYGAVQQARAAGMQVALKVLVGEGRLLGEVQDAARGDPQLEVDQVRDRSGDVLSAIGGFRPHILHFFCHGAANNGQPRLLLGTPQDFEKRLPAADSSVVLEVNKLQYLLGPSRVWLVVLNCCEGGMAAKEVHSLANSLVISGVPAALGMREEIQAGAANEFSRVFYRELLADLEERLRLPGGQVRQVELDWAKVLHTPRSALVERYNRDATTYGEWTLPVLYTHLMPYRIRVLEPPAPPPAAPAAEFEEPTDGGEFGGPDAEPGGPDSGPEGPRFEASGPIPDDQRYVAAMMEGLLERLPPGAPAGFVAELQRMAGGPSRLPGGGQPVAPEPGLVAAPGTERGPAVPAGGG